MACSTAFLKKINKRFERWSANQFFSLDTMRMDALNSNSQIQKGCSTPFS